MERRGSRVLIVVFRAALFLCLVLLTALMTRYTQLGGDSSKSFYVPGENNLGEFNYFMDRQFVLTRRLQVLSMFRATDDKSIDSEHNSLHFVLG